MDLWSVKCKVETPKFSGLVLLSMYFLCGTDTLAFQSSFVLCLGSKPWRFHLKYM